MTTLKTLGLSRKCRRPTVLFLFLFLFFCFRLLLHFVSHFLLTRNLVFIHCAQWRREPPQDDGRRYLLEQHGAAGEWICCEPSWFERCLICFRSLVRIGSVSSASVSPPPVRQGEETNTQRSSWDYANRVSRKWLFRFSFFYIFWLFHFYFYFFKGYVGIVQLLLLSLLPLSFWFFFHSNFVLGDNC